VDTVTRLPFTFSKTANSMLSSWTRFGQTLGDQERAGVNCCLYKPDWFTNAKKKLAKRQIYLLFGFKKCKLFSKRGKCRIHRPVSSLQTDTKFPHMNSNEMKCVCKD
jgi:hypothetical protein